MPSNSNSRIAYRVEVLEGEKAFKDGVKLEACPYEESSNQRRRWKTGWCATAHIAGGVFPPIGARVLIEGGPNAGDYGTIVSLKALRAGVKLEKLTASGAPAYTYPLYEWLKGVNSDEQ